MKNILIPTDFSENSHNAIRYALEYFANVPMNFYILHVPFKSNSSKVAWGDSFYEDSSDIQLTRDYNVLLKEELKACMRISRNVNHRFFPVVEEEMVLIEAIRKQISEKDIDRIVMGTKGDTNSAQGEIGSHTYDVITKVKCPIMVIPINARFLGINNIAFITDYNSIYRNKVITTLSEALALNKSPLRVLNIRPQSMNLTTSQVDNKGFLHYFFRDTKHSFHFLENKNLETGIQDFVDTWDIGMVAIGAKNLNFIQRLMLRPTSDVNNYHTDIPFLVLHE